MNQQLRQVNVNAAGGRAEIAGSEQSLRVLGNAADAYQLGLTQIALGAGRTVRLDDLGQVRDLYAEQRSRAEVDGRPALAFDFKRAKGASDVTVFREAKAKLEALEKRNPQVQFKLRIDGSKYALMQYKSAIHAMIEGAILAVFVVFLFLRDKRATFISALAIPLSAIPTFWFMDLMGFSLNGMTLLALSLVAGVLVDDAIVEIENIVRHMRMGKSAYQASIDAADEIGLAVLATTMAIVAVFLPVGLMPGVSGQFFKNFGLTVVVAVLMSLAVARLITPMIAAYFLKASGHASHGEGFLMDMYQKILLWTLDKGRSPQLSARGGMWRFFGKFWDHRTWVMGMGALSFVLTIVCFGALPLTFQPDQDQDRSTVTVTMVPGTTLAQTKVVIDQVAKLLAAQPEVDSVYSRAFVGNGRVTAALKEKRDKTSIEFERALAPRLAQFADARVNFQSQFGFGDNNRPISVTLGSSDPGAVERGRQQAGDADGDAADAGRAADRGRPEAARNRDQAAARSGREPGRDDAGIVVGDPDRDAGRHRPEQRAFLVVRSSDPDPGRAGPECAVADVDDSEPAGADPERRLGPAQRGRRYRLRFRPDPDHPDQPAAPADGRLRSGPGRGDQPGDDRDQPVADHEEPADRRAEAERRPGQVAAGDAGQFRDRGDRGHLPGLCGAGAALSPVAAAAGQHGIAVAGAAGRADRAADRRSTAVDAGVHRAADAARASSPRTRSC